MPRLKMGNVTILDIGYRISDFGLNGKAHGAEGKASGSQRFPIFVLYAMHHALCAMRSGTRNQRPDTGNRLTYSDYEETINYHRRTGGCR